MTNRQRMITHLCDATTMSRGKRAAISAALAAYRLSRSCNDHERQEKEISYALAYAITGGGSVND